MIPKKIVKILNSLENTLDNIELNQFVINLENTNLNMRLKVSALLDKIKMLEKELKQQRNWEEKKKEYELYQSPSDSTVLYRKINTQDFFCPVCFKTKNIDVQLQASRINPAKRLQCPNCKNSFPKPKFSSVSDSQEIINEKNLV
jgi:hypothetical protein